MYFDPETCSFLGAKTHKGRIPDIAVELTAKRYRELIEAQRETDSQIVAGEDGRPVLLRPSIASRRELAVRMVKLEAGRRIAAFFPVTAQVNAMRLGLTDDPRFAVIDAIRAASNLIEQDIEQCSEPEMFPIDDNPLWPEDN